MNVTEVRADLLAEQEALDNIVSQLADEQWALVTPSPGWTVAHQIAHLAYYDNAASIAINDPEGFPALVEVLSQVASRGHQAMDDKTLGKYLAMTPIAELLAWRADRAFLAGASVTLTDDRRIPWYGPSMGAKSFLTARLMECWAHGQDIADAVGMIREPTDRLAHIAQLGFMTRRWTYQNRGLDVPDDPVWVSLSAPSGAEWSFGPDDAKETVSGSALDFCLVVTQRRHIDDTSLVASPVARNWLLLAQAFAGPATDGPEASRE